MGVAQFVGLGTTLDRAGDMEISDLDWDCPFWGGFRYTPYHVALDSYLVLVDT